MAISPEDDRRWMLEAVAAGAPFRGKCSPNPPVGCVLVKDGICVGRGGHKKAGGPHAEVEAIRSCADPKGTTAYVTLEPCNHHGRTGPCVAALLDAGVSRVVVGVPDPNPGVAGGGSQALRDQGIEVLENVAVQECEELMAPFLKGCRTGMPYVTVKMASTLDGRVGDPRGSQVWLTGEEAKAQVHGCRDRVDAILVGSGTVLSDDPQLTTRLPDGLKGHQPLRVIVDRRLRVPLTSGLVKTAREVPTRVYTSEAAPQAGVEALRESGVEVRLAGAEGMSNGQAFLEWVLRDLAREGCQHVWNEGGPELAAALFAGHWVDEVVWYLSMSLGGAPFMPALTGVVTEDLCERPKLDQVKAEWVGRDLRISGKVKGRQE